MKNNSIGFKLPSLTTGVSALALLKHYLAIIIFTSFGYFGTAILTGALQGDSWKYIQSVEKYYVEQGVFLALAILIGYVIQILLMRVGDYYFHFWKTDKYFYPIGYILTYLVINEIWGM